MAPKKGRKRTKAEESEAAPVESTEEAAKDTEMADAEAINGEAEPAADAAGDAGEAADAEGGGEEEAEAGEKEEGEKEGDAEPVEEKKEPPKKTFDVEWSADIVEDKRPKLKKATVLNEYDADITCVIQGNVISAVPSEQFKFILSGARATTGITAGRYVFEVQYLEGHATPDARYKTLRVGVGLAGSSNVAGSDDLSAGLDSDGHWWHAGKCVYHGKPLRVNDVVAMVVNLDKSSERCGTCSTFVNGARVGEPVKLDEKLTAGALFPLVAVRNVTAVANFGPGRPAKEIPFRGVMLNDAASADVTTDVTGASPDGKYEVLMPISMPNKGTFDFLDFCVYPSAKKKYIEISERALVRLLESSGLAPPGQDKHKKWKKIGDFQVKELMDNKFQSAYLKMATTKKRNYLIMDVAKNLQKTARAQTLSYFKAPHFVCRALLAFGEPSSEFVAAVQKKLYTQAVDKKKAEVDRRKIAWERGQALKAKKKEAEENLKAKKAAAEAEKKKKEEKADEVKEEVTEENKEEAKEEAEDVDVEPDWEELMKVDPEQFKEHKFMPRGNYSDIHPDQESQIFVNFSIPVEGLIAAQADRRWLPEGETLPPPGPEEGFSKVDFAWADKAGASAALDEWVKTKKKNEMVRNFRASKESFARVQAWHKSKSEWRTAARKDADSAKKAPDLKLPSKDAKKAKTEDAADGEEKKEAEEEKKEEEPAEDDEMDEEVDVWTTENIHDVNGKRLYKEFDNDDWTLATFRFELLNMLLSFKTDVTSKDADRVGIVKNLINQYYKAYYSKDLSPKGVGQENVDGVIAYFKDVIKVEDDILVLALDVPEGDENLFTTVVKCTEVARRERRNRVAAGDESAKLNIQKQGKGDKGKGKGQKGAQGNQPQGKPKGGGKGALTPAPAGKGKGPAITTGKGKPMARPPQNQYAVSPYPQAPGYGGGGSQKRPAAAASGTGYGPLSKKPRPTGAPQAPPSAGYYAKAQAYNNYNQYRGGRR
jgi:hypothetical protein